MPPLHDLNRVLEVSQEENILPLHQPTNPKVDQLLIYCFLVLQVAEEEEEAATQPEEEAAEPEVVIAVAAAVVESTPEPIREPSPEPEREASPERVRTKKYRTVNQGPHCEQK